MKNTQICYSLSISHSYLSKIANHYSKVSDEAIFMVRRYLNQELLKRYLKNGYLKWIFIFSEDILNKEYKEHIESTILIYHLHIKIDFYHYTVFTSHSNGFFIKNDYDFAIIADDANKEIYKGILIHHIFKMKGLGKKKED